jgi:hypothetical protein
MTPGGDDVTTPISATDIVELYLDAIGTSIWYDDDRERLCAPDGTAVYYSTLILLVWERRRLVPRRSAVADAYAALKAIGQAETRREAGHGKRYSA